MNAQTEEKIKVEEGGEKQKLDDIKGLGAKSITELKDAGVKNIDDLSTTNIEELAKKTSFSKTKLIGWQKIAKSKLPEVVKETEVKTQDAASSSEKQKVEGDKPAPRRPGFYEEEAVIWTPKTTLGKLVRSGKITDINEVFEQGHIIKEVGVVDTLLPNLSEEIIEVGRVQRVTDSGRRMRFRVVTAVGNGDGFIGIGEAKGKEAGPTIRKAIERAKLKIHPIKRGCGSWECGCGNPHTVPYKVAGKSGSVKVELSPAPRGVGFVA